VATSRSSSGSTDWQTLTIVDTPAAGSHFERDHGVTPSSTDTSAPWVDNPVGLGIAVVARTPTSVTLTITKPRAIRGIFRVHLRRLARHERGASRSIPTRAVRCARASRRTGYGNAATIDYGGFVQWVTTALRRTPQGGSVRGTQARAAIDVESYAGTWTGVTLPRGVVALNDAGQPIRRRNSTMTEGPASSSGRACGRRCASA
jgi:hypothetical protein